MEINMPIKDAKRKEYICKASFFVVILKPQNTFLILEECLCLNVFVILEDELCVIALQRKASL